MSVISEQCSGKAYSCFDIGTSEVHRHPNTLHESLPFQFVFSDCKLYKWSYLRLTILNMDNDNFSVIQLSGVTVISPLPNDKVANKNWFHQ